MESYIFNMEKMTSIRVSNDLLDELKSRKIDNDDSYEDLIWDLLEPTMELSEETKKNIEIAEQEFREGKTISHEELKKRLNL